MRRAGLLASAVVVAGLAVAVAAPSLNFGFVYDDDAVVVQRKPFWEMGFGEFLHSRPYGTGRHVAAVSLDLDRLSGGPLDPLPFHRTSIALSALLSVLVLVLGLRLGLGPLAATASASIFAVHPVHVDSVAWISGRCELLSALGVVGVMILALRPTTEDTQKHPLRVALGSAALAFVAVHSKENALCLPGLLVAARYFLGPRVAWIPALAGTAVALASWALLIGPLLATFAPPQFVDNPLVYAPVFERIPKAMAILWSYAGLVAWPHPLLEDRSWATTDPGLAGGWVATAAWLAAAAGLLIAGRRAPRAAFAAAWFPVSFAVTANVLQPIGILMEERLLLLPSVSACLLTGLLVDRASATARGRAVAVAAVALTVAALFGLFRERASVWESGDTYFTAASSGSPRSAKAQYDYGCWLLATGRAVEGEAALERALAIVPAFPRAASRLAESRARRGDPSAGADVYLAYLALVPDDAGAVTDATRLLLDAHREQEALLWAQRLVALKPGDSDAIQTLTLAEAAVKRAAKAPRDAAEPVNP